MTRILCLTVALWAMPASAVEWKGVNLAGAEFTANVLPGEMGRDYIYPSKEDVAMYAKAGFTLIRVPFLWERMQPRLGSLLNPKELGRLDAVVMEAKKLGLTVVLDPHNYGAYRGIKIGTPPVAEETFAHFWKLLARHYHDQTHVVFGLMNEPKEHTAEDWRALAQAAINAIRSTGAGHYILVPGTFYTGAHSWHDKAGKLSNAEALAQIKDPEHKLLIEIHHYFDEDYSGTHEVCTTPEVAERALQPVTDWLKAHHLQAVLAEFGASGNEQCLKAMEAALQHLDRHPAQWKGWAYWAASVWFGNYPLNVYPADAQKFPQLQLLQRYIR